MRALLLPIDMPEQGPCRPLRADERVLAAHGIEITAPQQPVVVGLRHEGQHLQMQIATLASVARCRQRPEPGLYIGKNASLRYQQLCGLLSGGKNIQPLAQTSIFIGEERDQLCLFLPYHAQTRQEGSLRLIIGLQTIPLSEQIGLTQ